MKSYILILSLVTSLSMGIAGCGKSEPSNTGSKAADNTDRNKVDRDGSTQTPGDQSESTSDIKITADIRRSILDDKGLSTNAHNAKIVTDKGAVTLRGVVDNASEKQSVEARAKAVAGVTSVDNQLEIKNP